MRCGALRFGAMQCDGKYQATAEKQSKLIDDAGGAKGIEKLVEMAAAAGDTTSLLEAAQEEVESEKHFLAVTVHLNMRVRLTPTNVRCSLSRRLQVERCS